MKEIRTMVEDCLMRRKVVGITRTKSLADSWKILFRASAQACHHLSIIENMRAEPRVSA